MKHALILLMAMAASQALAEGAARQDLALLRELAQQFLEQQAQGLPGQVQVTLGALDGRVSLPACDAPQAFFAPGARAWGKTSVGLRCAAPAAWTIYLQARVSVMGSYVISAIPLAQGQTIEESQLRMQQGDLAGLPNGIVTDMAQVVGRATTLSLAAGMPLRQDTLRVKPVVQQGQLIRLISGGNGFRVSSEARAISTGGEGQVVQARTAAGAIISGVARAGGQVEVVF